MAARSVICLLENRTDIPLIHVDHGHSSGEFTDPWYPPGVVEPRQVGEWRSESDGFMTGAIGFVKYSIIVDRQRQLIELSRDNQRGMTITNDFSGTTSTDILPKANILVGTSAFGAFNDTTATYIVELESKVFEGFAEPSPRSRSQKLNLNANPAEWAGDWDAGNIYVTLHSAGDKRMTANVTDLTITPALQFTQDFDLGHPTWVAKHALSAALNNQLSGGFAPLAKIFRLQHSRR